MRKNGLKITKYIHSLMQKRHMLMALNQFWKIHDGTIQGKKQSRKTNMKENRAKNKAQIHRMIQKQTYAQVLEPSLQNPCWHHPISKKRKVHFFKEVLFKTNMFTD